MLILILRAMTTLYGIMPVLMAWKLRQLYVHCTRFTPGIIQIIV
jgi:hypothetical protein